MQWRITYYLKHQYAKGVVMMCSADNFYQEFVVEGEQFQQYKHNF